MEENQKDAAPDVSDNPYAGEDTSHMALLPKPDEIASAEYRAIWDTLYEVSEEGRDHAADCLDEFILWALFAQIQLTVEIKDHAPIDYREHVVLNLLAKAWNKFLELPTLHGDEQPDFRKAIHDAQRILMARKAQAYLNELE